VRHLIYVEVEHGAPAVAGEAASLAGRGGAAAAHPVSHCSRVAWANGGRVGTNIGATDRGLGL
jgi:hypothetical protein